MSENRRFICGFYGHWLGGFALVDAASEEQARERLLAGLPDKLKERNAEPGRIKVWADPPGENRVTILWAGDY